MRIRGCRGSSARTAHQHQQQQGGQGGEDHQLVIVHVSDDLRLLVDDAVQQRGAVRAGRIQQVSPTPIYSARLKGVTYAAISACTACVLYQRPSLLTLGPNGGMRFAFPPHGAVRVSVKGGWYYAPSLRSRPLRPCEAWELT